MKNKLLFERQMTTYLLAWNPSKYPYKERLEEMRDLAKNEYFLGTWSVSANQRNFIKGDRIVKIRTGAGPLGIIGLGFIEKTHVAGKWEGRPRFQIKWIRYSPDAVILSREELERKFDWNVGPLQNGRKLSEPMNATNIWNACVSREIGRPGNVQSMKACEIACRNQPISADDSSIDLISPKSAGVDSSNILITAIEGGGGEAIVFRHKRNRFLRDQKLKQANGICECCRTNFKEILGGKGVRALQVHHRKQLALLEAPTLTALEDLAVVCANCHSLIHIDPEKAMKVEGLSKRLRNK